MKKKNKLSYLEVLRKVQRDWLHLKKTEVEELWRSY